LASEIDVHDRAALVAGKEAALPFRPPPVTMYSSALSERTNMLADLKIGLNPLPWVLASGFDLSVPVLRTAFSEIATTPFRAIKADPQPA
jgi:hypothetical protein